VFKGHTAAVEDCSFRPDDAAQCCSVGRDRALLLWDARSKSAPTGQVLQAHADDINAVSWNPLDCTKIITGGSDCVVNLFDIRKLGAPSAKIALSTSVINVAWSPHDARTFAVADEDATVRLFRTAAETDRAAGADPSADAPAPVPLFTHLGHRSSVADLQWNPAFPWVLASVSDDSLVEERGGGGSLQIWRVNEFVERDPDADADWAKQLAQALGPRSRSSSVNSNSSGGED
jgi:histone-binding protein RBBP4